jgi:hypothetical protein
MDVAELLLESCALDATKKEKTKRSSEAENPAEI